jgi:2-amino-4-hydroxy-6-hydroxymethyldihydropteridine diphosphokinase
MSGLPYWSRVSSERVRHIERVARLMHRWAEALALSAGEQERWLRAAWLHDALRDASEAELRQLAPDEPGPVELLHGPAAAERAEREGEDDPGILSAIRWHSVGSAHWDQVGRALYCADFLEPGRSFDREARAALAERYPSAPEAVLLDVAGRRVGWMVRSGWAIPETTWRFWNQVVGESSR